MQVSLRERLIDWLWLPIIVTLVAVQYCDGSNFEQPISMELASCNLYAWVLVISLCMLLCLIAMRHHEQNQRPAAIFLFTCFFGILPTLLINQYNPWHEFFIGMTALSAFAWLVVVGVESGSRAVLAGCTTLACLFPLMCYVGFGIAEKSLILLFLTTCRLQPGRVNWSSAGERRSVTPRIALAAATLIAGSACLSMLTTIWGDHDRDGVRYAKRLETQGVMTMRDGLRMWQILDHGQAGSLTDADMSFLSTHLGRPLKEDRTAVLCSQSEVLSAFYFVRNPTEQQTDEMSSLTEPFLRSSSWVVRLFALRAVCHLRHQSALPVVTAMLKDSDRHVRDEADRMLRVLSDTRSIARI